MDEFIATFLAGDALRALMVHACNHAVSFVADPITDSVCSMLTAAVNPMFSATALMPFCEKAHIALPYTLMTPAQRTYVYRLLGDARHGLIRRNNCVEVRFDGAGKKPQSLPAFDVLLAMCEMVMQSSGEDAGERRKRLAVANILLQRVRCNVYIAHDVFVKLQARVRDVFPEASLGGVQEEAAAAAAVGRR
jgi:hypothetical protein